MRFVVSCFDPNSSLLGKLVKYIASYVDIFIKYEVLSMYIVKFVLYLEIFIRE